MAGIIKDSAGASVIFYFGGKVVKAAEICKASTEGFAQGTVSQRLNLNN